MASLAQTDFCTHCNRPKGDKPACCHCKKIIFLDIDGVLINEARMNVPIPVPVPRAWETPDPACIEHLNWLIEQTGAEICVSSCWRVGRTIEELVELLAKWGVRGKVCGRTGMMQDQRGMEIAGWLQTAAAAFDAMPIIEYVILDDGSDMGEYMHRLVKCDFRVGLTRELAERAKRVLNGENVGIDHVMTAGTGGHWNLKVTERSE